VSSRNVYKNFFGNFSETKIAHAEIIESFFKDYNATQLRDQRQKFLQTKQFIDEVSGIKRRFMRNEEKQLEFLNVFDVLGFKTDEVRHSQVLAWLFKREKIAGSHFQDSLFFKEFCKSLGLPLSYADENYGVTPEESGEESRIDISIKCASRFIINIENKVHAGEGYKQLKREWDDLKKSQYEYHISDKNTHAYFLTKTGYLPKESFGFKSLSWEQIATIVRGCTNNQLPVKLRWFLNQYLMTINEHILGV
jgi:hypothetical protein